MLIRLFAVLLRTLGFLIHKYHRSLVSNTRIRIKKKKTLWGIRRLTFVKLRAHGPFNLLADVSKSQIVHTPRPAPPLRAAPRRAASARPFLPPSPLTCTLTCYVAHATTVGQEFNDRQPCKAGRLGFARHGSTRLGSIRFDSTWSAAPRRTYSVLDNSIVVYRPSRIYRQLSFLPTRQWDNYEHRPVAENRLERKYYMRQEE